MTVLNGKVRGREVGARRAVTVVLVVALPALLLLSGCGSSNGNTSKQPRSSTTTAVGSAPSSGSNTFDNAGKIYLVKDSAVVTVRRDGIAGGRAALESLLAGPTAKEAAAGMTTGIPTGTKLLSYTLANGTTTADFSGEMLSYGGGSAVVGLIIEQVKASVLANEPGARSVVIRIQGVPAEEALQP